MGVNVNRGLINKLMIFIFFCLLSGCSTVATREKGETLRIRGIGSAKWPDGAEIKGEPIIRFPTIPIETD